MTIFMGSKARLFAWFLSVMMVVSLVVGIPIPVSALQVDDSFSSGTYEGTGAGRNGDITLSVTIQEGSIADIQVLEQSETPRYWAQAVELLNQIIEANSTDVDGISGATLSSDGIREAAEQALQKASLDIPGSGTAADPYRIQSAGQLAAFAARVDAGDEDFAGAVVSLGADIDLSDIENWNPIGVEGRASGNEDKLFHGVFLGNGHEIQGLNLEGEFQSEANIGLFSTLGSQARVSDVILTSVHIDVAQKGNFSNVRAGALAGDTLRAGSGRGAVVSGCRAEGSISLQARDGQAMAGGVLGRLFTRSAMVNCVSEMEISAHTEGSLNAAYAGGLAGMTGNGTVLANSVALGNVRGVNVSGASDAYAGGLAGLLSSAVYNCYALGEAAIQQHSGAGIAYVGALAGQQAASSEGSLNYYAEDAVLSVQDEDGSVQKQSARPWAEEENGGQATAEALSASELQDADAAERLTSNLTTLSTLFPEDDFNWREWSLDGGKVLPVGAIWEKGEVDGSIFDSGSGTPTDPYIIRTKDQLKAFSGSLTSKLDYAGTYIRLGNDIDISGEDWQPIGGSFYRFDGDFDGNGKIISGLTEGSPEKPLELDGANAYIGLFGWLNEHANVHDLSLQEVAIFTHSPGSAYIGGIAGRMNGTETEGDLRGTRIDHCSVEGVISHTTDAGTTFVGGICGHVFKGTILNTMTNADITCVERSGELAEAGGIAGLLNRGLVANCYTLGSVTGSGYRDTQYDIEGMACLGNIAAVDGGTIVNCYTEGGVEALEYSIDTGLVTGWVTGIARAYNCWYNQDASMVIDGRKVSPVDPFGEVVPGGVSDEYFFSFPGALVTNINAYEAGSDSEAEKVAQGLNASFEAFPVDIESQYGLSSDALDRWTVQDGRPVFGEESGIVQYVQPDVEKNLQEEEEPTLQDGQWFGRSEDQSTVVRITVKDGDVERTEFLKGESSGEAADEALARARFKALYGDTSHYDAADLSRFRGKGTEKNPYLIENEDQLRYLAASINEDVDWHGTYFRQTKDITITGGDWQPIGWGIFADVDGDGFGQDVAALYPFRGSYDGDDHTISGVNLGTADAPASAYYTGLFGIIQGDYEGNEIPSNAWTAKLKNIHLKDVSFVTENRWRNYIGGLVGNAQGGFEIDNCSVTGRIDSSSMEDFAFAGGLTGSLMYGVVSDCWTDVDVSAWSGKNYSYSAGLSAVTNRATVINSYALGDVHGDADQTNRAEVGGFIALDGGLCVNCYASGNVETVSKYSMYVGGFVGMAASSSEHRQCYFNADALQKIAGTPVEVTQYAGKFVNESKESAEQRKSGEEIRSEAFRKQLEQNRLDVKKTLSEVREAFGADANGSSRYHSVYYNGDGSDLNPWTVKDGVVGFDEAKPSPEPAGPSGGGGGGNTTPVTPTPQPTHEDNCPSKAFTDLNTSAWYHEGTDFVIEQGLMNGVGTRTFAPNATTTRAMIVTILYRMEGSPKAGTSAFTDLADDWYKDAVHWAAEQGIVKGTSETTFAPNDAITREQMAAILARYAAFKGIDTSAKADLSKFSDEDAVTAYAVDSVAWAVNTGLMNGVTATTLDPKGNATRAQVAVLLQRAAGNIIK